MRIIIFEKQFQYYTGPALLLNYHSKQWFEWLPSIKIVWMNRGQYEMQDKLLGMVKK